MQVENFTTVIENIQRERERERERERVYIYIKREREKSKGIYQPYNLM
jgi:hypothetical protein